MGNDENKINFDEFRAELNRLIKSINDKKDRVRNGIDSIDSYWTEIDSVWKHIIKYEKFISEAGIWQESVERIVNSLSGLRREREDAHVQEDNTRELVAYNRFLERADEFKEKLRDFPSQQPPSDFPSQQPPTIEVTRKKAIVIGINEYPPPINNLKGAEYDATELCKVLKKNNFDILDEHFLVGQRATYRTIAKAINDVFRKPSDNNIILFYFSGHGFKDENNDVYIAPCDIDPDDPYVCGISTDELSRVMDKSKNNSKFITILDCCYAGVNAQKDVNGRAGNPVYEAMTILDDKFKKMGEYDEVKSGQRRKIILAACQENESAHEMEFQHDDENHYHGIFSYYLIEALGGKGIDSVEGKISMDKIYKYIDGQMKGKTKQKISYQAQNPQDGITIIASFGEYDNMIKQMINKATNAVKADEFGLLFLATKNLGQLQKPELKDRMNSDQKYAYEMLTKKLNSNLKNYGAKLANWFHDNQYKDPRLVFSEVFTGNKDPYYDLSKQCKNLSFEYASKAPEKEIQVIMAVYDFMKDSSENENEKLEDLRRSLERQNKKENPAD